MEKNAKFTDVILIVIRCSASQLSKAFPRLNFVPATALISTLTQQLYFNVIYF